MDVALHLVSSVLREAAEQLRAAHEGLAADAFSPMMSKDLHDSSRNLRRKRGGGPQR
jgi:hypothetical protein